MIYTVRHSGREVLAGVAPRDGVLRVEFAGREYTVEVSPRAGRMCYLVTVDGIMHPVAVFRAGNTISVVLGADRYEYVVIRGPALRRADIGARSQVRQDISAPMPGLIVSTLVKPGETVAPGRVVAVMEAMKMQMEIRALTDGRVLAVPAKAGEEVSRGTVLVTLETGRGESE